MVGASITEILNLSSFRQGFFNQVCNKTKELVNKSNIVILIIKNHLHICADEATYHLSINISVMDASVITKHNNFLNLCHYKNDFHINAFWSFFATSHCKNEEENS